MKYIIIITLAVLTFSCKNNTAKNKENSVKIETKQTAELVKNEFNIKGMTCEIGCAKLIQSKLSKLDGVNHVNVSFKDSIGMIEYDKNKVSFNDIEKTVNNISDGNLYKVYNQKSVSEFSIK